MRGSVSARLSVRFSSTSAALNVSRLLDSTSIPPGSSAARPLRPSATCRDARRLVPASVSTSEPSSKSNAASVLRPASLAPGGSPVQPSRDHEMQHQPQIALEADGDALADALELPHAPAARQREGRLRRAQQEGARKAHPEQRPPHDARFERGEVGGDIRQLGHPRIMPASPIAEKGRPFGQKCDPRRNLRPQSSPRSIKIRSQPP